MSMDKTNALHLEGGSSLGRGKACTLHRLFCWMQKRKEATLTWRIDEHPIWHV